MHRAHVEIPWKHVDDWIAWMDELLPGWTLSIRKRTDWPSDKRVWLAQVASIKAEVYAKGFEDHGTNFLIDIDSDRSLMLLKLTWNVVHIGSCAQAKCCLQYVEE